jgi:hypothetical protein
MPHYPRPSGMSANIFSAERCSLNLPQNQGLFKNERNLLIYNKLTLM